MSRDTDPVVPDLTTVLVIDDHPTVHLGLASVLTPGHRMQLVGSAMSGAEGVTCYLRERPDVVLLDLAMPHQDGHATLRRLLECDPEAVVVMLSASTSATDVARALRAGAAGYVLKDVDGESLVAAVQSARRGEVPIDPRVTRALVEPEPGSRGPRLTRREFDVLRLLCLGLNNRDIGQRLGIGHHTVKSHLRNAFASIGVSDRTSAALWARRHLADVAVR